MSCGRSSRRTFVMIWHMSFANMMFQIQQMLSSMILVSILSISFFNLMVIVSLSGPRCQPLSWTKLLMKIILFWMHSWPMIFHFCSNYLLIIFKHSIKSKRLLIILYLTLLWMNEENWYFCIVLEVVERLLCAILLLLLFVLKERLHWPVPPPVYQQFS